MKQLISLVALGLALAAGGAHAADAKAPAAKSKLATCSAEAKGLKGDEYKKKRDECMKGDGTAAAATAAPAASAAPTPACEKSAADKKLHGAAKNAHIKKCMAEAK
jgi:hypothetical protein